MASLTFQTFVLENRPMSMLQSHMTNMIIHETLIEALDIMFFQLLFDSVVLSANALNCRLIVYTGGDISTRSPRSTKAYDIDHSRWDGFFFDYN